MLNLGLSSIVDNDADHQLTLRALSRLLTYCDALKGLQFEVRTYLNDHAASWPSELRSLCDEKGIQGSIGIIATRSPSGGMMDIRRMWPNVAWEAVVGKQSLIECWLPLT